MYNGKVAALFIDPKGIYPTLPDVECWGPEQDARLYRGPHPVVCHCPCHRWVNLAAVNWKRYGKEKPAWYPGGDDGGCFEAALKFARLYGGVLEHPAYSHAFDHFGISKPSEVGWNAPDYTLPYDRDMGGFRHYWTALVYQSAYGHKCQKKTWLIYFGYKPPFELRWDRNPGTHQVGWFDRNRPTVGKREASASPIEFAEELVKLARWSHG
jgi:hypothetical protein